MKIEEVCRDELLRILTTVKDVSPLTAESVVVAADWDAKGNRTLRIVDQMLGINIVDENLNELLGRYEVAVEMAEARMGGRL